VSGVARARDMPEVRARALRMLRDPPAALWRPGDPVPPGLTGTPDEAMPAAWARWEHTLLASAALYWVSAELTSLAAHAAGSLPAFRVRPELVPSRTGLLAWADPVRGTDRREVVAASWRVLPDRVWVTDWLDPVQSYATLHEVAPHLLPAWHAYDLSDPAAVAAVRGAWGRISPDADTEVPLDVDYAWARPDVARARAVTTLVATWLLMGQTLTTSARVDPAPVERRRLARAGAPTDGVTYVALRRQQTDQEQRAPGEGGRGHAHRWWVRGHWRNQYYPSVQTHRPIWIDPHLKGPEGAPLLHRETVYTLRR